MSDSNDDTPGCISGIVRIFVYVCTVYTVVWCADSIGARLRRLERLADLPRYQPVFFGDDPALREPMGPPAP